ncbi:MAG: ribonuclease E/G [Magnetococcales bacterium]|nr:ribonuclease E/G [Magnetococcales bacterium]
MTKRMLVDATHTEEIRVAIIHDNRLIDLDIETSSREQIKGNIYLARVSRVEPSLQAAFIDFGCGRQGFLSINDIHPKYYPNAEKSEREEYLPMPLPEPEDEEECVEVEAEALEEEIEEPQKEIEPETPKPELLEPEDPEDEEQEAINPECEDQKEFSTADTDETQSDADLDLEIDEDGSPLLDTFKRFPRRPRMPIQKILTRGQKLLVQVVKEPRGNKGASLTTNLSLAGRYAVLLPENEGGGGISRKITDAVERKKLKEILETIAIPGQVSLIIRTAGLGRTKREIIRDLNYLLRLWKKILENAATIEKPSIIHEEGDLIMRTIRDLYATDMAEILIEGQDGYRRGKDFMRLLMPSYLKVVQPYKEAQPIFSRFLIENQIESMHDRIIQLKAGGYIVIESTEALVSIDINSGRSTREKDVETTAYKTNLQATEEIARQLRLRDLGGLIVIDFIDMEDKKHNLDIEKQMREALKLDRAKIQVGRISQFGLLELSRQRMKPTFNETNRMECPRCKGLGTIRSVESTAIHLFRMLEEDTSKNRYTQIIYRTSMDVANYLLNHKRSQLMTLEAASNATLLIQGDETLQTPEYKVERTERPKPATTPLDETKSATPSRESTTRPKPTPAIQEPAKPKAEVVPPPIPNDPEEESEETGTTAEAVERKKRRRRRRRKTPLATTTQPTPLTPDAALEEVLDIQPPLLPESIEQPQESALSLEPDQAEVTTEVKPRPPRRRRRRRSTTPTQRTGEGSTVTTEGNDEPEVSIPRSEEMVPPWEE